MMNIGLKYYEHGPKNVWKTQTKRKNFKCCLNVESNNKNKFKALKL